MLRGRAPPLPPPIRQRYVDDIKALALRRWKVAAPAQKHRPRERLIEKTLQEPRPRTRGTNSYLQPFTVITARN